LEMSSSIADWQPMNGTGSARPARRRANAGAGDEATGFDLYACVDGESRSQTPVRVPTGIAIETPLGPTFRSGRAPLSAGRGGYAGYDRRDYRGELLVTMYVLPYREPQRYNGDRSRSS
jgi:dUTPase